MYILNICEDDCLRMGRREVSIKLFIFTVVLTGKPTYVAVAGQYLRETGLSPN